MLYLKIREKGERERERERERVVNRALLLWICLQEGMEKYEVCEWEYGDAGKLSDITGCF